MNTDVVIVGGGPSGLTLGLALARHQVKVSGYLLYPFEGDKLILLKSMILEKEHDITQDPRGVVLTGDALRSLWTLGLGKHVSSIGQGRHLVSSSKYCTLQSSCEVVSRDEHADGVTVHYLDSKKAPHQIHAAWLVGADGKRGIVRKHFLEPSAGVRQEPGIFEYEGTWIAANLEITLPTPQSHPDLALWAAGLDPESVYDLFWPANWHFCRPPGKPVACGRFGPHSDRLWRHEFAVPEWDDSMDANAIFWEHLTPLITRNIRPLHGGCPAEVTFPRDCIEVLRCRPFRFSHRVVNKWFTERTMLIGDAAHVFPPFGGQGVACGVQDAVGLAWRLAILTKIDSLAHSRTLRESLLQAWADERRMGTDNSARLTRQNGELCNKEGSWSLSVQLACLNIADGFLGALGIRFGPFGADSQGYRGCVGGGFITEHGGGIKLGQVYVQTRHTDAPVLRVELSDQALRRVPTILTLLVIAPIQSSETKQELVALPQVLRQSGMDPAVLSEQSIVQFDPSDSSEHLPGGSQWPVCRVAPAGLLIGYPVRPGYSSAQFMRRLGDSRARYVIVRPDNIVIAMSRDLYGLKSNLGALEKCLS
ncbi:putative monooxygenase [Aspergillus novofumigatus IBT 16806]|uniref:Putative monooxygenase n=1 Tax=Aspergillus novofumigatus (strain IBT 16806) TaxID=1392255 RepID=A0A2I1C0K1_ASPN1|nr:putative monooxygenase [Aspergillus novofumigatus IBT 16806]PKX91170.1 putative monooxygenase [Aspergillus novofumigatus IBT 16806]